MKFMGTHCEKSVTFMLRRSALAGIEQQLAAHSTVSCVVLSC